MKYNDKAEKWIEIGFRDGKDFPLDAKGHLTGIPIFYVKDNGVGIREKHFKSIFRIFKRLHGRDKFGGGTGAGLTITKKLVERHGGRLWVESTFGEGATFFFTLERSRNHGDTQSTDSSG
jgi:light-regulated signal transduction histidine kinase (bacteriophytochrome)